MGKRIQRLIRHVNPRFWCHPVMEAVGSCANKEDKSGRGGEKRGHQRETEEQQGLFVG